MAGKKFDASPKALLQYGPADWPAFVGVSASSVEIVDADVSTVTAATDKVLLVHAAAGDRIQHFDFQSGPDATMPCRMHRYNPLLEYRHELPVESILVLLARKANLKTIDGNYERKLPSESQPYLRFRYRAIRVWELPVETVLSAGPSVLPLAPISDVPKSRLPWVIKRMEERFAKLDDPSRAGELWTATSVLMGLRYDKVFTEQLLQGVRAMKESVTYQAIVEEGVKKGLEKGEMQEARKMLLRIASDTFNCPPNDEQMQELQSIANVDQLEDLAVRVRHVRGWSELLAMVPRSRRRKKT